jgi:hypothetical protein
MMVISHWDSGSIFRIFPAMMVPPVPLPKISNFFMTSALSTVFGFRLKD